MDLDMCRLWPNVPECARMCVNVRILQSRMCVQYQSVLRSMSVAPAGQSVFPCQGWKTMAQIVRRQGRADAQFPWRKALRACTTFLAAKGVIFRSSRKRSAQSSKRSSPETPFA